MAANEGLEKYLFLWVFFYIFFSWRIIDFVLASLAEAGKDKVL